MKYNDISAEWKALRKDMGNFFCHIDNMMTRIENGERKLVELGDIKQYANERYLEGFYAGYASAGGIEFEKSDIDKIYSALSPESQRIIFAMAQKFLDLEEKKEE